MYVHNVYTSMVKHGYVCTYVSCSHCSVTKLLWIGTNFLTVYLCTEHDFPAHSACYHGNLSLLIMLIDGGHCGINDQDVWGATPAHKGVCVCVCVRTVHMCVVEVHTTSQHALKW